MSIVPPDLALETAAALVPHFDRKASPVYVDCNAISPLTAREIATMIETASGVFVDGSLIGPPPTADVRMPRLYVSGPHASRLEVLIGAGLDVRRLDGTVGTASALKNAYGGLTKGLTGITAALILAADRARVSEILCAEMAGAPRPRAERSSRHGPEDLPLEWRDGAYRQVRGRATRVCDLGRPGRLPCGDCC